MLYGDRELPMAEHPEHRSILVLDIEGYGHIDRTDLIRLRLHRRLDRLCTRLLRRAGGRPDQYRRQDTGDGFLVSIQAQVAKTRLLAAISWLATELARDNQERTTAEQLRLRVALHAGEVFRDPDPLHGEAIIFACRLLDTDLLRACLRATSRPLALIVSHTIHDAIIRHHFPHLDPAAYHPVIARTKEARRRAWVHVPGDSAAPVRAGVIASTAALVHGEGPIPQDLPPDLSIFTGRDEQLGRLRALLGQASQLSSAAVTVVLYGPPGVGKSALAIRAAHQVAEQFPDGQLYVDLRGPTPGLTPLQPVEVLRQFLQSLGIASNALPAHLHEIDTVYRSVLADRRLLIMLDNAQDAAQVRPLLPGQPTCAVLITSRATLGELDGAAWLAVDMLDPEAGVRLLGLHAGPERIIDEPVAAGELARRCGYLPLALRIIGARARLYPAWTLRMLADRLADAARPLPTRCPSAWPSRRCRWNHRRRSLQVMGSPRAGWHPVRPKHG